MLLHISDIVRPHLNGYAAVVDTDALNQTQIQALYTALSDLSERAVELVASDKREEFQTEITDLTSTLIDAIEFADEPSPPRTPPVQVAVTNPHKGNLKNLRGNFGQGVHEKMHFAPTDTKKYHGVWTAKASEVRKWVRLAIDSIYAGDTFVVASKPGTDGGYTYLVFMDTEVGYLSGSAMQQKPQQNVRHIEVYVDKKGNTTSAFPSDPSIF